jgi:hypothetical protein
MNFVRWNSTNLQSTCESIHRFSFRISWKLKLLFFIFQNKGLPDTWKPCCCTGTTHMQEQKNTYAERNLEEFKARIIVFIREPTGLSTFLCSKKGWRRRRTWISWINVGVTGGGAIKVEVFCCYPVLRTLLRTMGFFTAKSTSK